MTPRLDHRPPIIAFLFLVVLAIAVVGTNARALDRTVVAGGPIAAQVHVSGTALLGRRASNPAGGVVERSLPVSRASARPQPAAHPEQARPVVTRPAEHGSHVRRSSEHAARHRTELRGRLALGRHFRAH